MNIIEKLALAFQDLPGIGPRQAKRFVFALLEKDKECAERLSSLILDLNNGVKRCSSCFFVFEELKNTAGRPELKCPICENLNRDKTMLLVVQKEIDLENIENSRVFNGRYFILGGAISLLNKNGVKKIRMRELFERIKNDRDIKEIIIAMAADREGETTNLYINKILEPFVKQRGIKITRFGRGLSSGAEIEYADKDTIENAFLNRK